MALYVAATPIGNLGDASERLKRTLEGCALVLCEDTRVTQKLYAAFGLKRPRLLSSHQYNEEGRAADVVAEMLEKGLDVALVTDAGTPGVSDPGFAVVRQAAQAGIEVLAVPGPSAASALLSICGFEIESYAFFGFLPRKGKEREAAFARIARACVSVAVVYESPHRVKALLRDVEAFLPGAQLCLSCDLTKLHEKTLRGGAAELLLALNANPSAEKGEYALAIELKGVKRPETAEEKPSARAMLLEFALMGLSAKEAVARLAAQPGYSRNEAYAASLEIAPLLKKIEEGAIDAGRD
ncbi:MAG: 16S rRNA (cytidine(1402)-2'-O)-methyltransferase [Christensenellaceae bacterium]|jgi:16S rRNA (cytidine1402-2'-O)-methyltransferase|nr:16S rRNA (cytidine(1402)-2'-O)-methyltransferase [Christensenellaceae bacterium]